MSAPRRNPSARSLQKKIHKLEKALAKKRLKSHKAHLKKGRTTNPAPIPRDKWISGQIRVTKSGKIQAKIKR